MIKHSVLCLSLFPLICAGSYLNKDSFNNYNTVSASLEYVGGMPSPTGEVGTVRQGCALFTSGVCVRPYDVWGAGYTTPGGLLSVGLSSGLGLPSDGNSCYVFGVWGLTEYAGVANTSNSRGFASMSSTYSSYAFGTPVVVVSRSVKIPQTCSDIPSLTDGGNVISVPLQSDSLYVNLSPAPRNTLMDYNSIDYSFVILSTVLPSYFEYSALVCSSSSISSSTCKRVISLPHIDLGDPGSAVPVPPTECTVEGSFTFDLGTVSKTNYTNVNVTNIFQATCSRTTNLTLTLINGTVTSDGLTVILSVNNSGSVSTIPLTSGTPSSFPIKAAISYIDSSAEPGEYNLNDILLISYD